LRPIGPVCRRLFTGESPLVQTSSNQIGGTLSRREIEEIPSNFRNFTALTQLVPGMTPNPAASTFEGGQVVANGTPSQQNVYLLDGMYNNDDRLGGSQGTQVRLVLDNIDEYQVLSNSYSAEYGGGAGAIINMVTRGGTNNFSGRVYGYFRDDKFNNRNAFLPDSAPKPDERTMQAGFGIGGPIVRDRAHFYFTMEKDHEDIAGQKRFPPKQPLWPPTSSARSRSGRPTISAAATCSSTPTTSSTFAGCSRPHRREGKGSTPTKKRSMRRDGIATGIT
jgi:hypothetical protein